MINSAYTPPLDLIRRPRRNRQSAAIRALVREHRIHVEDLIQPLFVKDGHGPAEEIESLPGISRLNLTQALAEVGKLSALGIRAVALFPQIDPGLKSSRGKYATLEKNWFFGAIRQMKLDYPEMLIVADVALDPYTDHGHDGVLDATTGDVANDETVHVLTHYATMPAPAGTDIGAPSPAAVFPRRRSWLTLSNSPPPTTAPFATRSAAPPNPARRRSTSAPTSSTPPTCARPCSRRGSMRTKARTSSWSSRRGFTSMSFPRSRRARFCPWPRIRFPGNTRRSMPPRARAGSISKRRATNRSSPSSAPGPTSS